MTANSSLCRNTLPSLTDHVLAPAWRDPRIGIVHLGIGNFHRAHEAVYTEEAMLAAGGDWGICGVTLQGDVSKRDALMAQNGLYSVVERGPEGVSVTVIRALKEVLAMPHDRARLFELLADRKRAHRLADGHRKRLLPRYANRRRRPEARGDRARSGAS